MPGLNPSTRNNLLLCGLLALILSFSGQATAHNVDTSDAAFLQAQSGVVFWPYRGHITHARRQSESRRPS